LRTLVLSLAVVIASGAVGAAAWAADPAPAGMSAPMDAAQAALARSRAQLACRFAFTLEEEGEADMAGATWPADAKQTLNFDPRRPIGERWKIIRNEKNIRKKIRRQFNWGGRSDPRADMLTITLEGDVDITDLTLKETRPDMWVFAFKPFATSTVNRQAHVFLNAMEGELWISRQSGDVVRRVLRVAEPFDTGLGRVRTGDFVRTYAPGANGHSFTRDTAQKMQITVQGRGVDAVGRQTISEIVPICDPAEVQAIAEMEARDVTYEKSDQEPATGSRLRSRGRLPSRGNIN
jgi:hypothetical protein